MNSQFKKGVLELIVLRAVNNKDMYGYELITVVSNVVDVNDGTIYPLLRRLTTERYFDTYLVESSEGPPRKYYKLTSTGKERLDELTKTWEVFSNSVNKFLKESESNE